MCNTNNFHFLRVRSKINAFNCKKQISPQLNTYIYIYLTKSNKYNRGKNSTSK